jgi:hypothetical protein
VNSAEHAHEAALLLTQSATAWRESDPRTEWLQRSAQVHATLALVIAVQEIGDQLDTLPRPQAQPTSGSSPQLLCGEPTAWYGQDCGLFGGHPGQHFPQSSSDE